jgi:hypothetical protein
MARTIDKNAFFAGIGYKPHKEQIKFHTSGARFRFANCGRRFGKSTMAARDLEPKLFMRDRNNWIVAPTYDLGEKEFRVIWNDLILGRKLGRNKDIKKAYNKKQGNMYIQFPWNTILEVRTADQPEMLVGDSLDHVIMSEAAKHKADTWIKYIRPSLADRHGSADFPTTPEGYNWLYDEWMRGQDENEPDYASWKFPSWANLEVYPGGWDDPEIQLLYRTTPKESFDQEIGADFGSFSGKIYPEWDSTVHVHNVTFNPAWKSYVSFDWGYTNPLAAVFFQISPDDQIYIWREHYLALQMVKTHIHMLKQMDWPDGYHLDLAFGDAADPEAAMDVSTSLVGCIADPRAKENWREGVDLVRSFMQREVDQDEFGGPIYAPAIHVDFSCVNLIREFNGYKAPSNTTGKNVTELGLKMDDHALDALRYGVVHIYKLGAQHGLREAQEGTGLDRPLNNLVDKVDRNSNIHRSSARDANDSPGSALADLSSATGGIFTMGGRF